MKKLYFVLSVLILALVTLLVPAQPGGGPIFVPPRPASDYIASLNGNGTNAAFWGTLDFPASGDQVTLRDFTGNAVLISFNTGGDNPVLRESGMSTTGNDLTVPGTLTGSATGNDVKTHERFQFANRASTTVSDTASDTTLTNATASGSVPISAGYLTEGTVIEIEADGATVDVTANPITLKFKLSGATIASGEVIPEGDAAWHWKSITTIRTDGAGGTFVSNGLIAHENNSGATYPRGSGSINTTTAKTIDFTGAISGATGDIICSNLVVKITRP